MFLPDDGKTMRPGLREWFAPSNQPYFVLAFFRAIVVSSSLSSRQRQRYIKPGKEEPNQRTLFCRLLSSSTRLRLGYIHVLVYIKTSAYVYRRDRRHIVWHRIELDSRASRTTYYYYKIFFAYVHISSYTAHMRCLGPHDSSPRHTTSPSNKNHIHTISTVFDRCAAGIRAKKTTASAAALSHQQQLHDQLIMHPL